MLCEKCKAEGYALPKFTESMSDGLVMCIGGHITVKYTWTREQADEFDRTGPRFWFSGPNIKRPE